MKVEILDKAQNDLLDGFRFYENQSKGLGDYFLDSLFSDIASLQVYAGVHSVGRRSPRYCGPRARVARPWPLSVRVWPRTAAEVA